MRTVILSIVVWTVPVVAAAQSAAPAAPVAPPQPSAAAAAGAAPGTSAQESYTYQPDGRRDPFLTLVGVGTQQPGLGSQRPNGPAGISVDEVSVRGVMQSRGSLIAMIQGADNKAYVVHAGDKLLDGVIKVVTPQGLVIVQEVNDPLSIVKQREVTRRLRSQEDAK